MMSRIFKILLGLVLLPFCAGFTWQLGTMIGTVAFKPLFIYYFIGGGLTYLTLHMLFRKPVLAYVFGHELTHAFFAVLFGGSVKSFHASSRGGRVTITKSNFLITLAPYFFPLYTSIVLLVYWAAYAAEVRGAAPWLTFLTGATFTFHLVLTFVFLQVDQDDIREHGAVFSYPLIYLFNILFASLLVRLILTEGMDYTKFLSDGIMKSINMTVLFMNKIALLFFPNA